MEPSLRVEHLRLICKPGNTKWGSISVPLTSCLTGLDESVLKIKTKFVSCHTADSKLVKQEVNSTIFCIPCVGLNVLSETKHSSLFVWKVSDEKEQFFKIDKSQIVFVVNPSSTNFKGSNSWWGLSLSFDYINLPFSSHWVQVKYLKR